MPLTIRFVEVDLPLTEFTADGVSTVESLLKQQGEPLRWAITDVDQVAQVAKVEAVITHPALESAP